MKQNIFWPCNMEVLKKYHLLRMKYIAQNIKKEPFEIMEELKNEKV